MFTRGLVTSDCDCKSKIDGDKTCFMDKIIKNIAVNMEDKKTNWDLNSNNKNYKNKSIDVRKEEVLAIRNRFPTKIPIIVQRFAKESNLPQLEKTKFLVPQELTMSQFLMIIKNRIKMKPTQSLYLLVNDRSLVSLSITFAEVYAEHAGPDGFLYITYASQETFGAPQTPTGQ
ncbi:microtubule-associated proteins 1A/1B light chain 3C-like [Onthophagus taurus]|uniref:microtubule-associated proteins 1A/1B light chain 3C-like n=1 Tax=Onthophagus taurus TaxID=166361 RepID=UPI000C20EE2B|nr:microtubule-associated proteins 1A/1B light chain 3C-like [Onthophagus taurus]